MDTEQTTAVDAFDPAKDAIVAGRTAELGPIPADGLRPFVQRTMDAIVTLDGQARVSAASALMASLDAAPRDTAAGSDEALLGAARMITRARIPGAIEPGSPIERRTSAAMDLLLG